MAAIPYSLIETCRLSGVDLKCHIGGVGERAEDGLPTTLPRDLLDNPAV